MAGVKTVFFCTNCGHESPKWEGRCLACGEWNTYIEEKISKAKTPSIVSRSKEKEKAQPKPLPSIVAGHTHRIDTRDGELNRVLGGGLVHGSIVLVGGQPGIGKSTLMLQLAMNAGGTVLYVSGEESEEQIKMRADRLGTAREECFIYTETSSQAIIEESKKLRPALLIIDSIQTLYSPFIDAPPGSISQVRECTAELQRFAKESNIPIIIIGHITKEGGLAGPKVLEHIVDVVLQFEGDQNYTYRILRTLKNRFGSTDELGIYAMESVGLREVSNPSELLMSQNSETLSGSVIAASLEGMRPLMIETQALVTPSVYGTPQRSATGFDLRRLAMLLAVLEKRCGLPIGHNDVFLNIAGGIRVTDPAIDLAIFTALISSLNNIGIGRNVCFAAEIGLTGEIRGVSRIEQRIQEADRLGFDTIYIAQSNMKNVKREGLGIDVRAVSRVEDLLYEVFG
ncbi:MAG TPA: DNA repair protein RadA [Saprospiraceae bacterium]|nr:DNA repair protein RadA [Saprospiraceae bacterium]HRG65684.1 DNA repair protein RadA [Saprospiraceae bacterium]